MKATATLIVLLLAAGAAQAQERPDYSRDTLMRFFANEDVRAEGDPDIRFYVGAVAFRALGQNWRINYLPIMAPLPGTRFGVTREWPDAFALTNTPIATTPRTWRTTREMNAELRRIERVTRPKATVKVNVD
jgi:hypothetical protein